VSLPARVRRIRRIPALLLLSVLLTLAIPVAPIQPPVHANPSSPGMNTDKLPFAQIGASFNPARAAYLGLDYQVAYDRLLALNFKVIRLSAYWSQVDEVGYDRLDWLVRRSEEARQPIVISVGMKGVGWPEFYIPKRYSPELPDGSDISSDHVLRSGAVQFVAETVERYRDSDVLVAWQVENEPLNPAGPRRWWIGRPTLEQEVAAVKARDQRPVVVNAFGSFNMLFDRYSNRNGIDLKRLLGFESDTAENQSLETIDSGDILGLDVYTRIGYSFLGRDAVASANSNWAGTAGHWRQQALKQGKGAWITEVQAEPWETSNKTLANPRSTTAADIVDRVNALRAQGYTTILLWGAEYWLWRADDADTTWLDAVQGVLAANNAAPALLPASADAGP
jgi:hypothetical protein